MKQKENRKTKKGWIKVLIILAIPVLLIGGLRIKNTIWPPESEGIDYAKVLSLQSQAGESSELADVEKRTLEVKYINKEEKVETRPLILYVPQNVEGKIPLIYIPHYEIEKDSAELRQYLAEGWLVASPTAFDNAYNGILTADDMVFNNAALYTLRNNQQRKDGDSIVKRNLESINCAGFSSRTVSEWNDRRVAGSNTWDGNRYVPTKSE